MRDTRFPLDMVWITDDRRIAEITRDIQPEPGVEAGALRRYSPGVAVRYVLEISGGAARALGLEEGDVLQFQLP
jgi:uncharacterized membrane protein (UPF0127 family)